MSRVQELESRLREILEKARDWQRVPVRSSPGIFVVKAPGDMSSPTVMVGRKPISSYVLACLHALQQNGSVEVRARGRAIPKAIGAVQVLREGLVKGLEVESVDIGTERLQGKDGREIRVSTISIRLSLPEKEEARSFRQFVLICNG